MARTATIIFLTGDYAERLQSLLDATQEAREDAKDGSASPRRAGETDPATALAQEYEALRSEAEEKGVKVRLTAVGRREWRTLRQKHPLRTEGDEETVKADRAAGVNTDSVEDDLVYACMLDPQFKTRAAFDEWADDLSEGEWQTLVGRAWELTNGSRFNPKSLSASPTPSTEPS